MPMKKKTSRPSLAKNAIRNKLHARKKLTHQDDDELGFIEPESKKTLDALEHNRKQMIEMQNKIMSAPAMNGGFSTLMYKIEKIEQCQEQLVEKVDDIRDVLYDPDSGLYARIKKVETEKLDHQRFDTLASELMQIKSWKTSEEKAAEKEETEEEKFHQKINEHSEIIKDLQSWHHKQTAITKWLAITVGGGALTLLGKLIYDLLSSHIQII